MSRIGKNPISIPQGVEVKVSPEMVVEVKGPKGTLTQETENRVSVKIADGAVIVERPDDTSQSRAFHGLYQRLISNMVQGVTEGFKKELEIEGVGWRAAMKGKALSLNLGYSHPIDFPAPEGITFETPEATQIVVSGFDKCLVGQVAADIRKLRKPEPYKGKGIRYKGEYIRRKVGKTGA